jgi:hypothetical protein
LPTLTNARFAKAVERIRAKEYTVEKLLESFALSEEQQSVLEGALANAE